MTEALFDVAPFVDTWSLEDRFGVPPFSVLDTRSGRWQARRARWETLQLDSDEGRGEALTFAKNVGSDPVSQILASRVGSTSIFDPVLAEVIYRWWTPAGGLVLDPFAGGSVRGIVAAMLGRAYHGVDLSAAQVDANEETATRLEARLPDRPRWYQHDSAVWQPDVVADAVVSCPPYGSLEQYTDHPRDLSNMLFKDFATTYKVIIQKSINRLRPDRFAVFVVGNYREGSAFRDLVGLTVEAFGEAGASYYGDLVLINSAATAGIRASSSFNAGRKPIIIHQHVLVFVKGDWKAAARATERIDPLDATG